MAKEVDHGRILVVGEALDEGRAKQRRTSLMAVVHERVWGGCNTLSCGSNNCDGHATAIAESRSRATARREARSRVRRLKNLTWRAIRQLDCPSDPKNCRRKKITYIYSPAPARGQERYFRNRRLWWVQYNIRWQYRVSCLVPLRLFATRAKVDTDNFWKEVKRKEAARSNS